jgi:23S rRNA (cytidine1920-2'-O)/16S rRNA (cytidine1409-2'-O)-methyltransferase
LKKSANGKRRLDVLVVERGFADSREKAQALIMAGMVLVDEQPATKAGTTIPITRQCD